MSIDLSCNMKACRPGLFLDEFEVQDEQYQVLGTLACLQKHSWSKSQNNNDDNNDNDDCYHPVDTCIQLLMGNISVCDSMMDAFQKAAQHIKSGLKKSKSNTCMNSMYWSKRPDHRHTLLDRLIKQVLILFVH